MQCPLPSELSRKIIVARKVSSRVNVGAANLSCHAEAHARAHPDAHGDADTDADGNQHGGVGIIEGRKITRKRVRVTRKMIRQTEGLDMGLL